MGKIITQSPRAQKCVFLDFNEGKTEVSKAWYSWQYRFKVMSQVINWGSTLLLLTANIWNSYLNPTYKYINIFSVVFN